MNRHEQFARPNLLMQVIFYNFSQLIIIDHACSCLFMPVHACSCLFMILRRWRQEADNEQKHDHYAEEDAVFHDTHWLDEIVASHNPSQDE